MISERSKAIILLTGYLPSSSRSVKPLSTTEWNNLAIWLSQNELFPEDLLVNHKVIDGLSESSISIDRINQLLDRSPTMAICLDKWERAGIWVINRSDENYPNSFKKTLKANCPPLFYGVGNKKLLKTESVGVVGSRNANDFDLDYSYRLGKKIAYDGLTVISGGAKGVDEYAMLGALENDGTSIGILADKLLRRSTSKIYRNHIINKNLVLMSPFNPEAGFNVGNAMARNKYIYVKSVATFVVHSGLKGGTWNGAVESLKNKWTNVFVKSNNDDNSGNEKLIKQGGTRVKEDIEDIGVKFDEIVEIGNVQPLELFSPTVIVEKNRSEVTKPVTDDILEDKLLRYLISLIKDDHPDGFELSELKKSYGILSNQSKKWIKRLKQLEIIESSGGDRFIIKE